MTNLKTTSLALLFLAAVSSGCCTTGGATADQSNANDLAADQGNNTAGTDTTAASPSATNGQITMGYRAAFVGHSFFIPVVKNFRPDRFGVQNHNTLAAGFAGDLGGAPGAIWTNPAGAKIRTLLGEGNVNLLGMTSHTDGESTRRDYERWVELAVKSNPETVFVIHAPHTKYLGLTFNEYRIDVLHWQSEVESRIDWLRKRFPNNTFLMVPQGAVIVALWEMINDGKLTDLQLGPAKGNHLFADDVGHLNGTIPLQASELLLNAVVYQVDATADTTVNPIVTRMVADVVAKNERYTRYPQ